MQALRMPNIINGSSARVRTSGSAAKIATTGTPSLGLGNIGIPKIGGRAGTANTASKNPRLAAMKKRF